MRSGSESTIQCLGCQALRHLSALGVHPNSWQGKTQRCLGFSGVLAMFPAQLTLWGENFGVSSSPPSCLLSWCCLFSFVWDRDMLGPAVKLACISQHPFCHCQKGSITLRLYGCQCTDTSAAPLLPLPEPAGWMRAAGWHSPVGASNFLSA